MGFYLQIVENDPYQYPHKEEGYNTVPEPSAHPTNFFLSKESFTKLTTQIKDYKSGEDCKEFIFQSGYCANVQ